jgi:tetratricopeptide (TPR) repeat protein
MTRMYEIAVVMVRLEQVMRQAIGTLILGAVGILATVLSVALDWPWPWWTWALLSALCVACGVLMAWRSTKTTGFGEPRPIASGNMSVAINTNYGTVSNLGVPVSGDHASVAAPQQTPDAKRAKQTIYGDIPRRPPAFQPRDDIRHQLLNAGRVAIISTLTGARGTGKSQLAAAYARDCIEDGWPLVAWLAAEHSGQILSELDSLSKTIGLRHDSDDAVSAAMKVRRWLETSEGDQCLIVFDNASDPDSVSAWLPSVGGARIVITSNRHSFENLGPIVDVEAFTAIEARSYLRERTGLHDDRGADALAGEVGGLPLALAQAAAVIKARRLSYSEFVGQLKRARLGKYLTRLPGDAYPRGAVETILVAFRQAARGSKVRRGLLLLLSMLSPDGVSRELLYSAQIGSRIVGWPLVRRTASREQIDEAVAELVDASLVTLSFDGRSVITHRFTQRVIREYADAGRTYELLLIRGGQFITNLLEQPLFQGKSLHEQQEISRGLIDQVSALWSNFITIEDAPQGRPWKRRLRRLVEKLIDLPIWSIEELYETINVARAIELATSALRASDRALGPDDPRSQHVRHILAMAYANAGQPDRSIELEQQIVAARERILGRNHLGTLESRNNVAGFCEKAGRFQEAINLGQEACSVLERLLGPQHPDTLTSRNNLAAAYHGAGRIEEAIEMHRQNLADTEQTLGPDHPHALMSRDNLATGLEMAGRVDETIEMRQQNLVNFERVLGPGHVETLVSRGHLAAAYRTVGRIDEAIELYRENLAARERLLGPDHPATVADRRILDEVCRQRPERGQAAP